MQTKLALATLTLGMACFWGTAEARRIESDPVLNLDAAFGEINSATNPVRMDLRIARHRRSGHGQRGGYYRTWTRCSPSYGYGNGYGGNYYSAPRHRGYYPYPSGNHQYPTHGHGGVGIHGPNGSVHIRF